MTRCSLITAAAMLAWLGTAPAAAAQPVPEERVKELVAAAMAQAPQTPSAPASTALPASVVDLTLEEALALGLEQNLDIAVERLNPQSWDYSLAALRGVYRPVASSTLGYQGQTQLPTNQLVGGAKVTNDIGTYNFGLAQQIPWWGGNYSVTFNNRSQNSNSAFVTFDPQYNATFTAQMTQPILRGFKIDATRQQLKVTKISRDMSEVQLQATITNTLASVRFAYFDLLYAKAALGVAQRSLDLAEKLVDDNKVRVEVGAMAPIDIVQAQAEAATRRQAVAQAEQVLQTAQLALKRLIVKGTSDPNWAADLNPTTIPGVEEVQVDIEAAVRRALNERTDLTQARGTIESNRITMDLLKNSKLPQTDVVGSYALQGIGGTLYQRQGLGGPVIATYPGGYSDAIRLLRNREYPNWIVQLLVSYPLGTSAADASYARSQVQVNQAEAQLRALELQAATEVTNAGLSVRSTWRRFEASRAARELAQRRLEAEQSKFEVGMSTNFFVVQAQRDLADAENTALRAQLDYARSIVDFERLQQAATSRATLSSVTGSGATTTTTATR